MDPNTGHLVELVGPVVESDASPSVRRFNDGADAVREFLRELPNSRAKALAFTKLDECVLWTTQAFGQEEWQRQQLANDLQTKREKLEDLRKTEVRKPVFRP